MWNVGFNKIFEEMDKEFPETEELLRRVFRTIQEMGPSVKPYLYGYQITVSPDGHPNVREFGDILPSVKGLDEKTGVRQPLIDTTLDEKQNVLVITAEMPGLTKNDLKINFGESLMIIHAENGDKKYHTEIPMKYQMEENSTKATYINGILEIKIKIKAIPKQKTKHIEIE